MIILQELYEYNIIDFFVLFFVFLSHNETMTGGVKQRWEKAGDPGEIPIQARIRGEYNKT